MGHSVKVTELEPLPLANVVYSPEDQVLLIENGEPSVVGEEMAKDVLVLYDKDDDNAPTSAVAVRIDCAEYVLKPFVDAILVKYGVKPDQLPPNAKHKTDGNA